MQNNHYKGSPPSSHTLHRYERLHHTDILRRTHCNNLAFGGPRFSDQKWDYWDPLFYAETSTLSISWAYHNVVTYTQLFLTISSHLQKALALAQKLASIPVRALERVMNLRKRSDVMPVDTDQAALTHPVPHQAS